MEKDVHQKKNSGYECIGSVLLMMALLDAGCWPSAASLAIDALSASPWNPPAKRVELIAKHIAPPRLRRWDNPPQTALRQN